MFRRALVTTVLILSPAALPAADADLENGYDVNEVCAGCHGEFGAGGKEGEYPRIAGQPASFIAKQLRLFRARERANMPMLPHTEERELPDSDIEDVSAFLAGIELMTKLPPISEEEFNAFERLQMTKRLLNIARVEGDVEAGQRLYQKECASCHGSEGEGDEEKVVPMLAGQYTNYLRLQIRKYIEKQRIHDESDPDSEFLSLFSAEELNDIFAYLSVLDD